MLQHWTPETIVLRCYRIAEDYGVKLHLGWDENVIDKDGARSSGFEGDGDIYMLSPESYSSWPWFVLAFLHELSHMTINKMCADTTKSGQYGVMMKGECHWRVEYWCWNNALDLGRSIFGICLTQEIAKKIINCLSSYVNGADSFANFYYKERDDKIEPSDEND